MDTTILIVIAIFAIVVVAAFIVFRQRARVEIQGPLGTGLKLDASNKATPDKPAIQIEDAASKKGGLLAEDRTGKGVSVKRVETQDDIIATSETPGPKA